MGIMQKAIGRMRQSVEGSLNKIFDSIEAEWDKFQRGRE